MSQEKQYTKEELEGKVKKYGRLKKLGLTAMLAGLVGLGSSAYFAYDFTKYPAPEIYSRYQNAKETIEILKENRGKLLSLETSFIPYKNKEVEDVTETYSIIKGIGLGKMLEGHNAIESVERDMKVMENDSVFKGYLNEKKKEKKILNWWLNLSLLLTGGGMFTGLISQYKKGMYRNEISNKVFEENSRIIDAIISKDWTNQFARCC